MSEQLLQQILSELKLLNQRVENIETDQQSMKADLNENTVILKAICDRQEETDAKLENLTMDVHKIHGDHARLEEKVDHLHTEVMNELSDLKKDIDFTYQKTALNERELFKLKNN